VEGHGGCGHAEVAGAELQHAPEQGKGQRGSESMDTGESEAVEQGKGQKQSKSVKERQNEAPEQGKGTERQ